MAELDLKLAKKFWGRDYASDTLRTLARYLFERGFAVLVVSPNPKNKAALRLYERLGFAPKHRFWAEETKAEHEV
jgi:RimJ/RimL family protein N-acetyltransferase